MFSLDDNQLTTTKHGRLVLVDVADYQKRRLACLLAGIRLEVARIVAERPLSSDEAREFGARFGLIVKG